MTCLVGSSFLNYQKVKVVSKIRILSCLVWSVILATFSLVSAQSVSFELKESTSVNMVFSTIEEYQRGLVQYNYTQLNIDADTRWDLYVGANTSVQNKWDEDQRYSESGETPDVSIVQLRFRNGNNTSQISNFFSLQDINNPVYIIGSSASDSEVSCGNEGANAAGDYKSEPDCYQFNIDMLIKPGLTYRSGLYRLEIVYTIISDL